MFDWRKLILGGSLITILIISQIVYAKQRLEQYPAGQRSASTAGSIIRISAGSSGSGGGSYTAISETGRYVVFESAALDLAPGVISGSWDVYLHDQDTGLFERQSTRTGGAAVYNPGDYTSPPTVSADGLLVAFMSRAENLVTNDGNGWPDVFLHDRTANTTTLISAAQDGSPGNDASFTPVVSADGKFVAFQSFASNLVPDDNNNAMDVFIRDLQAGTTELVSVTNEGVQGTDSHDYGFPGLAVSADGQLVAFAYDNLPVAGSSSAASPNIYLRDVEMGTTQWVQGGTLPALSGDGRFLAFVTYEAVVSEDSEGGQDVYVLDRDTNQFERVTVTDSGTGGVDAESAYIQSPPSLSFDGRFVAFATTAGLVAADGNAISDVYLRDRQAKTTALISLSQNGVAGNGESHFPALSADATTIAFASLASDLIAGDTNGLNDIFIFNRPAFSSQPDIPQYLPIVLGQQ